MNEGGEEIASIETTEPGRLDLVPADPAALRRVLSAVRIRADYAAGNRLKKLEAHGSTVLETIAPPDSPREGLRSWSEHLSADFDLASGELSRLEQTVDFRFEQPDLAEYLPAAERLELVQNAEIRDATASVAASRITLEEGEGSMLAKGAVRARYVQQSEGEQTAASDDLFSASEPVFAAAEEMRSDQDNGLIECRGGARLWQGSNRIEGDRIVIDRAKKTLRAEGETRSSLVENEADSSVAGRINVSASSLLYVGDERTARYRGDVKLKRGPLSVSADELDVRFSPAEAGGESGRSLEEAVARGAVQVVDAAPGSGELRRGFGEFLRYLPEHDLAVLRGSPARVSNERDEETRGAELTYRISDDSLLVLGKQSERAYTFRNR
jgi:lipopolysaccharide transport protein LptA